MKKIAAVLVSVGLIASTATVSVAGARKGGEASRFRVSGDAATSRYKGGTGGNGGTAGYRGSGGRGDDGGVGGFFLGNEGMIFGADGQGGAGRSQGNGGWGGAGGYGSTSWSGQVFGRYGYSGLWW